MAPQIRIVGKEWPSTRTDPSSPAYVVLSSSISNGPSPAATTKFKNESCPIMPSDGNMDSAMTLTGIVAATNAPRFLERRFAKTLAESLSV